MRVNSSNVPTLEVYLSLQELCTVHRRSARPFPIAFTASVAGRICRYIACVDISELTADTARKRREYLNISKQPGPCVARALRV